MAAEGGRMSSPGGIQGMEGRVQEGLGMIVRAIGGLRAHTHFAGIEAKQTIVPG